MRSARTAYPSARNDRDLSASLLLRSPVNHKTIPRRTRVMGPNPKAKVAPSGFPPGFPNSEVASGIGRAHEKCGQETRCAASEGAATSPARPAARQPAPSDPIRRPPYGSKGAGLTFAARRLDAIHSDGNRMGRMANNVRELRPRRPRIARRSRSIGATLISVVST